MRWAFPQPFSLFISFQQLLAGSGLVVHRGASNVNHSADIDPTSKFVTEKAPRTALGLLSNGSVLSVAVDGVESLDEGPDLFELAELMILLGAQEVCMRVVFLCRKMKPNIYRHSLRSSCVS